MDELRDKIYKIVDGIKNYQTLLRLYKVILLFQQTFKC